MHISDSCAYASELRQSLRRHADKPVTLTFVSDVHDWCEENDVPCSTNPCAMALIARPSNQAMILVRQCIDDSRVEGVRGRLIAGGFDAGARYLDSPERFLEHLVLHELAHLANDWPQADEDRCDEWAFRAMGL